MKMSQENNQKLIQILDELKKEKSKEKIQELVQVLENCNMFVPAVLPPNTDPKIIKILAESGGKPVDIPREVAPRIVFLENKEKKRYLPLFTSKEQSEKGPQRAPINITLPYKNCLALLAKESGASGVVINPYEHNVMINMSVTSKTEKKEVKLTEPQLHAVIRQKVEADMLPDKLFAEKETVIENLRKDGGKLLVDLYTEAYQNQVACPYDSEEFDVMALNISEELTVLRVSMPTQKLVPGTCPMVLISWNPVQENLRYFGIVKGRNGEPDHICEAFPDGKKVDMGEAPGEGSEFQYIIDLNTPS